MSDENIKGGIKRRKFLKYSGVGVGLMLGAVVLGRNSIRRKIFETSETLVPPYLGGTKPNIWFQITPENEILIHSTKVEMGQGTFTGIAQLAAEELEVSLDRIKVVHAETKTGNIDLFSTGGSFSIASLFVPIREMAATMREMLRNKAAEKFEVSSDEVELVEGNFVSKGKVLTFGEVVTGVEEWEIPDTPKLKSREAFKTIGAKLPRIDLIPKIKGDPIFGIDATRPNMVYASIVRSSMVDAKMTDFDFSKAKEMPGVIKIVNEKDFVGVIAESQVEADKARKMIKYDYTKNEEWDLQKIQEKIRVGEGKQMVIQCEGDSIDDIEEGNELNLEFRTPIGAHAQLEPNGAVADYKDGKVDILISTQVINITRLEVAKALGIDKEDVNIIPTYLGGGFGRRLHTPHAVQTALMSKAIGRPVKCFFDRIQEFQNDTFRPPSHHIMRAKLSDKGELLCLEHHLASGDTMFNSALTPSIAEGALRADIGSIRGGAIMYRGLRNYRAIYNHVALPFATSFWRSLGLLANTFAIESMMDELALKSNKSPVDFRLAYLPDTKNGKRIKKVIEVCAEKSAYSETVQGNTAMGFAASIDTGSPCAMAVEVSIRDNQIKVQKVYTAFDCGIAVNPNQVRAQVEGCIIMGISASLYEKMDLNENTLSPINYGAYEMALMKDSPKLVETTLIEGDTVAGPVGEPPLGPIGAAIANAVRRITGKRLTELPMSVS